MRQSIQQIRSNVLRGTPGDRTVAGTDKGINDHLEKPRVTPRKITQQRLAGLCEHSLSFRAECGTSGQYAGRKVACCPLGVCESRAEVVIAVLDHPAPISVEVGVALRNVGFHRGSVVLPMHYDIKVSIVGLILAAFGDCHPGFCLPDALGGYFPAQAEETEII